MTDIKTKYPTSNADTVAITCTLTSLATSSTLNAGREAAAVDNTTNLDLDHLITGRITTGAVTPTANTAIELWLIVPQKVASGTPTWPDVFDGTDSDETATSRNVLLATGVLLWSATVDAAANRVYPIGPCSVRAACGGSMPPRYTLFVTQNSGQSLSSTASDHELNYTRIQNTLV